MDCGTDCNETLVTLGVGAVYAPEFQGADDYEVNPVPLVSVRNLNGFNLDFGGVTYDLLQYGSRAEGWTFVAGPLVGIADSRDEDDSDALDGLGDVDFGVDVGAFGRFMYGPVMLNLEVSQEVADGHGGTVVTFRSGTWIPVTERLSLSPTISTTWADDDYTNAFFGVDARQSAASGLDRYDAGAGFKDVGLRLGAGYRLTDNIAIQGSVRYDRLVGDATDSPIVTGPDGSPNQFSTLLGIAYRFSF